MRAFVQVVGLPFAEVALLRIPEKFFHIALVLHIRVSQPHNMRHKPDKSNLAMVVGSAADARKASHRF